MRLRFAPLHRGSAERSAAPELAGPAYVAVDRQIGEGFAAPCCRWHEIQRWQRPSQSDCGAFTSRVKFLPRTRTAASPSLAPTRGFHQWRCPVLNLLAPQPPYRRPRPDDLGTRG